MEGQVPKSAIDLKSLVQTSPTFSHLEDHGSPVCPSPTGWKSMFTASQSTNDNSARYSVPAVLGPLRSNAPRNAQITSDVPNTSSGTRAGINTGGASTFAVLNRADSSGESDEDLIENDVFSPPPGSRAAGKRGREQNDDDNRPGRRVVSYKGL